jgi:hypothetical protein
MARSQNAANALNASSVKIHIDYSTIPLLSLNSMESLRLIA